MFNKLTVFLSILTFSITTVYANDSCDSLIRVGVFNVTQSSSASEGEALAKSAFCASDYTSSSTTSDQRAALKLAFLSYFNFGGNGSDLETSIVQTQHNVCTSGFQSSSYSNQASSYSRQIYQGALDAWNTCQALAQKGLDFDVQTDSALQGLTVTLSAVLGTNSKFLGLTQIGLGHSICKTTLPNGQILDVNDGSVFNISSANKLTFVCNREMKADAAGNYFADAQNLIFNTSTGPYSVPLSGIGSVSRLTIDQALAGIKEAINADTKSFLTGAVEAENTSISNLFAQQLDTVKTLISNAVGSLEATLASLNGKVSDLTSSTNNHQLYKCPLGSVVGSIGGAETGFVGPSLVGCVGQLSMAASCTNVFPSSSNINGVFTDKEVLACENAGVIRLQ